MREIWIEYGKDMFVDMVLSDMRAKGWRWYSDFQPIESKQNGSKMTYTLSGRLHLYKDNVPMTRADWDADLLETANRLKTPFIGADGDSATKTIDLENKQA